VVGPDRHGFGRTIDLKPEEGLLEIESRGPETSDPFFVPANPGDKEKKRERYELTLRGRPDLKPGDFVTFTKPAEESDDDGSPVGFAFDVQAEIKPGSTVMLYVRGVAHRLAREQGFLTIVRGVSVPGNDPANAWFTYSERRGPAAKSATLTDDSPEGAL